MSDPRWLLDQVLDVVRSNRSWMTWNLVLAAVPATLAMPLLWRPHRRTLRWWLGVGVFVLFLPNAPYVLTDLIHLRSDIAETDGGSVVVFGVLPLYAAFIVAGFTSYLLCLALIVREVRSVRPAAPRLPIELTVHAICAVGIVLGRVARLNSWDTVQEPRWTAETVFNTLAWRGAPFALSTVFLAITVTSLALRALAGAAWRVGEAARTRLAGT